MEANKRLHLKFCFDDQPDVFHNYDFIVQTKLTLLEIRKHLHLLGYNKTDTLIEVWKNGPPAGYFPWSSDQEGFNLLPRLAEDKSLDDAKDYVLIIRFVTASRVLPSAKLGFLPDKEQQKIRKLGAIKEIKAKVEQEIDAWKLLEAAKGRHYNNAILEKIKNSILVPLFAKDWQGKPAGLLLYGPPGTGKTVFAEFIMNFFPIIVGSGSAARFFEKGVGDTQKNIRAEADKCKGHGGTPCCMFVDEFDSLGADRRDDKQGYKADFLNQFLAIVGSKDYPNLFVIAATNFKHKLDEAALRDGRIEHHIYVGPMDSEERLSLFKHSWQEGLNPFEFLLEDPVFKTQLLMKTINFTVSQLASVRNTIKNHLLLFEDQSLSPALFLKKLEDYLLTKRDKHNLQWNYLANSNKEQRTRFIKYDEQVADILFIQEEFPLSSGTMSGRFIVNLTATPQLELELCKGYHDEPKIAQLLQLQNESRFNPNTVFNLLAPVVAYHNFTLIQIINRDTFSLKEPDLFEATFKDKLEECRECCGPSMLVIYVDDLIGSNTNISIRSSAEVSNKTGSESNKNYENVTSTSLQQQIRIERSRQQNTRQSSVDKVSNAQRASARVNMTRSVSQSQVQSFTHEDEVNDSSTASVINRHTVDQDNKRTSNKEEQKTAEIRKTIRETMLTQLKNEVQTQIERNKSNETIVESLKEFETLAALELSKSINTSFNRTVEQSSRNLSSYSLMNSSSSSSSNTVVYEFKPLYPKIWSTLVHYLQQIVNYNQFTFNPFVVLVIDNPLTELALKDCLSWGYLDEPNYRRSIGLNLTPNNMTKVCRNISQNLDQLKRVKLIPNELKGQQPRTYSLSDLLILCDKIEYLDVTNCISEQSLDLQLDGDKAITSAREFNFPKLTTLVANGIASFGGTTNEDSSSGLCLHSFPNLRRLSLNNTKIRYLTIPPEAAAKIEWIYCANLEYLKVNPKVTNVIVSAWDDLRLYLATNNTWNIQWPTIDKLLEGKTMADIASFLLVGTVGTVIKIFAEPLIKDIKATLFTASQNLANDTAMKITILPLETASEVQPQQRGIVLGFDNVNQLIILLKN